MPRISSLPQAISATTLDQFPIVQGNVTKRISFLNAQLSGLFLPLDGSITTAKLAANSVTSAILASDLSNDSNRAVGVNHIKSSAVVTSKLADDAVTTPKILDLNVTGPKIAVGALSINKFNSADYSYLKTAGTARPGGSVVTSGSVENIVVYQQGSGYLTIPNITIDPSPSGDNATCTAIVSGGAVVGITNLYPGSGYTSVPTVTIDPSPGTSAKAVAYSITKGLAAVDSDNNVAGGWQAGFYITSDKKVKSVGYNNAWKLGHGEANNWMTLPQEVMYAGAVSTPTSFIKPFKIYTSVNSTFIIDCSGRVWSCGENDYGQLGLGDTNDRVIFHRIPSTFNNEPVVKMDSTQVYTYSTVGALTANNKLWLWGYNGNGQCGNGGTSSVTAPFCPLPAINFSDFCVTHSGQVATYAIEAGTGRIFCCGFNNRGQLSIGNTNNQSTMVTLKSSAGVDFVNAKKVTGCGGYWAGQGNYPTVGILTNSGEVWCAGWGGNGQLGNGANSDTGAGYVVRPIASGVRDLYANSHVYFSTGCFFALMTNGDVRAWGYQGQGSWGYGVAGNSTANTPQTIWNAASRGAGAVKIVQGGDGYTEAYSFLLDSLGRMWSSGYNGRGALGLGDTSNRSNWTQVYLNTDAPILDFKFNDHAGYGNCEILTADGKVYVAGPNNNGQLGNGSQALNRYSFSPILF